MPGFAMEERFQSGQDLYGDDFDQEAIAAWFRDEENAYADLWHEGNGEYGYHALNQRHGFRFLPDGPLGSVLAFGSAHGRELEPLVGRLTQVTLLDAADTFDSVSIEGAEVRREKAASSGDLPFPEASFDLITCLGVLHHIPNVSHVLEEFHRTLRKGGWLLMREPSTSMGDWSRPRPGLTPRERGIPRRWMQRQLERTGFSLLEAAPCHFSPLMALCNRLRIRAGSAPLVRLDAWLSTLFAWNERYVSKHAWQKFRPGSAFYVARKAR